MTSEEKPEAQAHGDTLPAPPKNDSLIATCHCGRVQVELPEKPPKLTECHCTVCYKYGALWGYFSRDKVTVTTSTGTTLVKYMRGDLEAEISFNRCSHCGCMTHWWGEGEYGVSEHQMGVNCRMLPLEATEEIPRRVSPGPNRDS